MLPSPRRLLVFPLVPVFAAVLLPLTFRTALAKPPKPPRTAEQESRAATDLDTLLHWLLANEHEHEMVALPFQAVIHAATGHRVLGFDPKDPTDAAVLAKLRSAIDAILAKMNAPDSPARDVKRINEASHHFEDAMQAAFNALPGLACEFAPNTAGSVQRSGYPDLRLTDQASGKIYYLDPKLYAQGSRHSSFRTFYFEPRVETNKVNADAVHLVVGIEHNGKSGADARFERWEFVDCSNLKVKLKAEFQAGNRDVYRDDAVVAHGGEP